MALRVILSVVPKVDSVFPWINHSPAIARGKLSTARQPSFGELSRRLSRGYRSTTPHLFMGCVFLSSGCAIHPLTTGVGDISDVNR